MPLSDHEQRILEEIERRLAEEDPKLVEQVGRTDLYRHLARRIRLAALAFVVGFCMILAFAISVWVAAVGFVVTVLSALLIYRYLGQLGLEASGQWRDAWSYRWFGEFADTSCGFYDSGGNFNCAYNHGIYSTGYRYRGRVIGHGSDNDARIFSSGLLLVDGDDTRWQAVVRVGDLNRGGRPDARNSLTATKQELLSIDLSHSRAFRYGIIEVGAGLERIDDAVSGQSDNSARAFIQWRTSR